MSERKNKVYHPKSFELIFKEEIFNTTSHAFGVALSIAALVLLIVKASANGSAWHIISFVIYGVSLVMLYSASTVFHSAKNLRKKSFYNKLDHAAIYLLIAGTYTPYSTLTMDGALGWSIFGIQWAIAIAGVVFKLFFYSKRFRTLSAILYLVMGWVGLAGVHLLWANLPFWGLVWLGFGCIAYSLGVIFYLLERIPFSHGIFHLFILAGSIFHFLSICLYVF